MIILLGNGEGRWRKPAVGTKIFRPSLPMAQTALLQHTLGTGNLLGAAGVDRHCHP